MPMQLKLVVNGVISPNSPRDTMAPMENTDSYLKIHLIKVIQELIFHTRVKKKH